MTDYNKSVNFAVKDTLTSGDPNKIVSGAEIDTEFNNIASSSGTKADKVSAATANNFAGLNASGNLIDSGKSSSDFADATETSNSISSIESDVTDLQNDKADKVSSGTEDNLTSLDSTGNIQDSGSSVTSIINISSPTGAVTAFAASTAPNGWLECDGSAVSRTTYSELFAVIGTTFGLGDGTNTFNLPDLRGEFVRGWDNGRGVDSGRAFASTQDDAFQGHYHEITASTGANGDAAGGDDRNTINDSDGGVISSEKILGPKSDGVNGTPRTASETRPRNIALMYIIKT